VSEAPGPGGSLAGRAGEELEAEVRRIETELVPLQAEIDRRRAAVEAIRTELRRRARDQRLRDRQGVRAELRSGDLPSLEDILSGTDDRLGEAAFDALTFLRESATEVRLGYAAAARQGLSLTDGAAAEEVFDVAAARRLWQQGWEPGTPATRGVRIYPVGSRAERVVPPAEIHVRWPGSG
jgi:multidrug efflux pump subunit AcrA (membrane-fusion protein)